jgi:hypothetical protein
VTEESQSALQGEASIEELLADPIMHLLLRYDRIAPEDVWAAVRDATKRLYASVSEENKAA